MKTFTVGTKHQGRYTVTKSFWNRLFHIPAFMWDFTRKGKSWGEALFWAYQIVFRAHLLAIAMEEVEKAEAEGLLGPRRDHP